MGSAVRNVARSVVIISLVLVALTLTATASARIHHTEPKPIDKEAFARLIAAMTEEKFADGKLAQLRAIQGLYLFSGAESVAVLANIDFWNDRLDGLRLILPADSAAVGAILRFFEGAPDSYRSEARRILRL